MCANMRRMGRKRKNNKGLPARVYIKHGAYYYVRPVDGKWIRLAKTLPEMHARLAEVLADVPIARTMRGLFERYQHEVMPTKAASTQRNNMRMLRNLEAAFGNARPDDVQAQHIYGYLDKRSAKTEANREISLLQHVFKKAIRWGAATNNPCVGVERNPEKPERHYVTDAQFLVAYRGAPAMIRYAMAVAYLTGQRQTDVLNLRRRDLLDEGVYFKQKKTGQEVIVEWTPALNKVIRRALTHGDTIAFDYVLRTRNNHRYSASGFQTAWKRLMCRLPNDMQFKFMDIRAKARSDGDDKRLLGHANPDALARVYQRKPTVVRPVR